LKETINIPYRYDTTEKKILKNNFSSNVAIKFFGHGDFGGSVGKGKQTKSYFRPYNK
jgi:hypothetical protein